MTTTSRGRAALRSGLCALAFLAATAAAAAAQFTNPRVGGGVRYESYSFGDAAVVNLDRVDLLTFPIAARADLGRNVELGVSSAWARATLRRASGSESEMEGFTDTEVRLTFKLADDRFRAGLIALVPGGNSRLSEGEVDVASLVAADLLPFAISSLGTGGGIGFTAATALPLSRSTTFGLSAGYVRADKHWPVDGYSRYRPGDQLHIRAALDQLVGSSGKASLQLLYQQFSEDWMAGTNIYQAGDRFQAVGTYAFAAGARSSGILYAGYLRRLEGEHLGGPEAITPLQDLVYAGSTLRQPLGRLVLVPSAEVRVLGSDAGIDQGYTVTAGTGLELPLGRLDVIPTARVRFGHITVREDQESGFTGMDLGLTLRNRTLSR